jgi:hypothetical protein
MSGRLLIVRVQLRQTELAAARRIMEILWIVGWWDEDYDTTALATFFSSSWCTEHMRRC